MAPSPYPFRLKNIAAAYAFAYASTHAEPSGHHQRFSTTISTHTHTDSSEEDEAMRRFLAASDYCFGHSDSDDESTKPSHRVHAVLPGLWSRGHPPH